jgi:hypothetical protein
MNTELNRVVHLYLKENYFLNNGGIIAYSQFGENQKNSGIAQNPRHAKIDSKVHGAEDQRALNGQFRGPRN